MYFKERIIRPDLANSVVRWYDFLAGDRLPGCRRPFKSPQKRVQFPDLVLCVQCRVCGGLFLIHPSFEAMLLGYKPAAARDCVDKKAY